MIKRAKDLKYLWVYSAADDHTISWHNKLIARRRDLGYDVEGFCITPDSLKRRWLYFDELDHLWKQGDRVLMELYEDLANKLENKDTLILYNGANLHPEFVRALSVIKIYTAGDDPESTEYLTKPVAHAFDIHLINNIACIEMYKSWGLPRVYFWPLGSMKFIEEINLSEEEIMDISCRTVPLIFFGSILTQPGHPIGKLQLARKEKLEELSKLFPEAVLAGQGWQNGFFSWDEMWNIYKKSQIGWNMHLSSGPINFRTYDLPAHGVLQICDNKSNLESIFKLNEEVIGFDTLEECIELTHFYLNNELEQRKIALQGWKRWKKDYHPDRVWERLVEIVEIHISDLISDNNYRKEEIIKIISRHESETSIIRVFYKIKNKVKSFLKKYN